MDWRCGSCDKNACFASAKALSSNRSPTKKEKRTRFNKIYKIIIYKGTESPLCTLVSAVTQRE
jgi:hypothetical protein